MVRKFSKTLLSLMVLVPTMSWGVGLGDIKLHSALNQPLNADIDLLSVDAGKMDTIHVQLASFESFAQVGIERNAVLMLLQFSVEKDANGTPYIKVTSQKPIREPFLDFLLEVEWSSGRLLREYTLLLDPPEMMQQAPMSVSTPSVGTTTGMTTTQPSRADVTRMMRTGTMGMGTTAGTQYGPTQANDTLWQIAERMRSDPNVSIYQMMMALYKANPDAFIGNNINRLKKGRVLRLDDPTQVTAMSKAEATQEFLRQTREWEDSRERMAESAQHRPATGTAMAPSTAVAPQEQAKLKLVAPQGQGEKAAAGSATGKAGGVDQQGLMMAMENAEALRQENQELNGRLEKLEGQLAAMQRLLTLKEDDLAALQQQLAEQGGKPMVQPQAKPETAIPAPVAATAQQPETTPAATTEQKPAPAAATQPSEAKPAAKPKPVAPAKPKPKPVVTPQPEPGIVDMLLDNLMLLIGGLVAIVVLVLGGIFYKRKKAGGGSFQESILSGGTSSMMKGGEDEQTASESSFLSDLAISGLESTSEGGSSEVDALTEADVYMAYGRYQQAEELLKDAMGQHPDKMELVAKLLEVYHGTKNADAFAEVVQAHQSGLQKDEAVWKKVMVMGHELAPGDDLFAGAEAVAKEGGAEETSSAGGDEDVLDIGLDLDALTAEMESEFGADFAEPEEKKPAAEDDFDIDLGLDFGEETPAEAPQGAGDELSMDFSDLDMGAVAEQAPSEAEAELSLGDMDLGAGEEEDSGLDLGALEMELGDFGRAAAEEESAVAQETSAETELAGLSMEEPAPVAESGGLPTDFDDLDLDAALAELEEPASNLERGEEDMISSAAALDINDLDELEGGLMADQDEVATKLDLARAYVDMGDTDGARQMLEEVAKDGSSEQQQQAQQLLAEIG